MSVKRFLAENQDTQDEVIVLAPNGTQKVEELERDLLVVRHHYHELGLRASALASERDAVAARLSSSRADAESARAQLEVQQAQHTALTTELEARLESQQAELREERRRRQQLEARLAQTDKRVETLLEQYGQDHQARDSELAAEVDALGQQLAAVREEKSRLEAEQSTLATQLDQVQQAVATERDTAREQLQTLEQRLEALQSEHAQALETTRELEAALSTATEQQHSNAAQLAALEQQRDDLATQLDQAQQAVATERDTAREQLQTLEQRLEALQSEHAQALETARELETALSAATRREREAEQHVATLEQTLQEERSSLGAELSTTRATLTEARTEQQQARNEQDRLTDALARVEQQLAASERISQDARKEAADSSAAAETAQRELGDKVRQLAEQLHQQHQQQDKLEQQARMQKTTEAKLRAELERRSSELQAEVQRLQEELEGYRCAARPSQVTPAQEPASPQDHLAGRPNSWKTVAGVSLLVSTVASATAYWSGSRDTHSGPLADIAIPAPVRPPPPKSVADLLWAPTSYPFPPLPVPSPTAPLIEPDADRRSLAGATPGPVLQQSAAPDILVATHAAIEPADATGPGKDAERSPTLQDTARESLRSLNPEFALNDLELQGDPLIQEQQHNLMTLGFDLGQFRADGVKGRRTTQALSEFQRYYLPLTGLQGVADDKHLASLVKVFADITRNDQQAFGIDNEVLAAIRLGSLRTGMDFPYLMELAYTESSFDPQKKARRSSATGLYQFTDTTWLNSIKAYGEKYGLGLYAAQIEHVTDAYGRRRPAVQNSIVREHVLALRHNPRIATLMAAEFTLENKKQLTRFLGPDFGRTEMYLGHFFGLEDAVEFLRRLDETPHRIAAELFPRAAESNPGVFNPWDGQQRTMQEVYDFFDGKFDTGRYEILNPGLALVQELSQ